MAWHPETATWKRGTYRQIACLCLSTRQSLPDAVRQILLLATGDRADGLFLELDRHGGSRWEEIEMGGGKSEIKSAKCACDQESMEVIGKVIALEKVEGAGGGTCVCL